MHCRRELPCGRAPRGATAPTAAAGRQAPPRALPALVPVGSEPGELPPAAHPDDQVAVAVAEAISLSGAFLRLAREARPQLAWRCEGVGTALADALLRRYSRKSCAGPPAWVLRPLAGQHLFSVPPGAGRGPARGQLQ